MSEKMVLEIVDLEVKARTIAGVFDLLRIDRLELTGGEILGIVGESGAGKSILALTIMGLLPSNVFVSGGRILYRGEDLCRKSPREMSGKYRGKRMTMIFQDPMASLNPVFTVFQQIGAVIREHHPEMSKRQVRTKALEMLDLVKLSDPEMTLQKYPHELSGGMRQRVLIATALSSGADLLISDEATRSLDVTIQAGILRLLGDLGRQLNLSTIFISSNIALAAAVSRRLGILYAGRLLEVAPVAGILGQPKHHYTRSFLSCLPRPDKKGKPMPILGGPHTASGGGKDGCPFAAGCADYLDACDHGRPSLAEVSPGHYVSCHRGGAVS